MDVEAVLLDLDGTVIDSYPGIQMAFDNAYLKIYSIQNTTSIKPYIGPPIPIILAKVNGENNEDKIDEFVQLFKSSYDTKDFELSVLYEGMHEFLDKIHKEGIKIFIVTNKRLKPTELITSHLNIRDYFYALYCIDSNDGYSSKTEMVKDILEAESLDNNTCILIGDTKQDSASAVANNIPFIYAAYGYGDITDAERTITKPLDALKFINNI